MPYIAEFVGGSGRYPLHRNRIAGAIKLLALVSASLASVAYGAEKSVIGGAALNYKWDDNINVSETNPIALSGWILSGFASGQYATSRFRTSAELKLDFERYNNASLESDSSTLQDPDPSDFNSDNQNLKANVAYDWELHTLSLGGKYSRDSTLNTQFTDTGLGVREVEGASRVTQASLTPGWLWQLSERQSLNTTLSGQSVDYESDLFVDYSFANASVLWGYSLNERMSLQIVPSFSWFRNEAKISVKSNTYGVQAGFLWAMTEKWQFDLLAGGSQVYTEYGQGGFVFIDPDTGQRVFVEDQDSQSFIGDAKLTLNEEYFSFYASVSSSIAPSGNGILRQNYSGRLGLTWEPLERMKIDFDSQYGQNRSTDDRIDDGRTYGEASVRLAYRFTQNWWVSGRYRFREQNRDAANLGNAHGNSVFLTLSYRLPKEIL